MMQPPSFISSTLMDPDAEYVASIAPFIISESSQIIIGKYEYMHTAQ